MGARFGRAGNRPAERGDGAQGRCGNAHRAEVRCDEPHPVALAYPLLRYPARSLLLDRRPLHGRRQDVDHAMAADRSPPYRAAAVPGAARTREAMSQARSSRQRYRGFVQDYKQRRLDDAAEPGDSPRPARGERRASVREYLGLLQMALVSPVVSLIRLAVAVAVLLVLNWRLALTAMAVVPGAMLISFTAARRIRPIYRSMRKDVEHIDGRVGETFSGIRIVRAFRRELQELLNYMRGRHTVLRKELFAHRRDLVGRSGAGKTTVTDLVARFHDPTRGRILLNGSDVRDFRLRTYRDLLAIVQQDVFLFDGSVRENIAYGRRETTDAEIEDAARRANAHEFIVKLPEQYETSIGERGVKLSGGQQQRLAIARAILASPQILILDEATSNLDTESEQLIQASMATLLAGRTTFVIAHRLSTIRRADMILLMDDGRVTERGTHEELMAARGAYHGMVLRQVEVDDLLRRHPAL